MYYDINNGILDALYANPLERPIDEAIKKCIEIENSTYNEHEWEKVYIELTCQCSQYIPNLGNGMQGYVDGCFDTFGFKEADYRGNFLRIKNKLIAFKNMGYNNTCKSDDKITIQNNMSATQTQNQTVSISFEDVTSQIKNMTSLSDTETMEILSKIEEIEAIIKGKDNKKAKWSKLKPFLTWLADKSVDVGLTLLPLLLKIGS